MDVFLQLARDAFRRLYGLAAIAGEPVAIAPPAGIKEWSRRHRVMGLIEAGLNVSASLPSTETESWQRAVFGQARHTTTRIGDAERLCEALSQAGAKPILVKGPALAAQAWPDPGIRSFDDLDLVCRTKDFAAACRVITDAGYRPEPIDPRRFANLWHFGWGVSFKNDSGSVIELNHRFFPPHYPWPDRLKPQNPALAGEVKLDATSIPTLNPAAHLLLSCLHGAWHGWERLSWVADIAGLLVRYPSAFSQAEQLVEQDGYARRALHTGCAMAEAVMGPGICQQPLPSAPTDAVTTGMILLERTTPAFVSREEQRAYHRIMLSRIEYLTYECRRAATPGDGDFRAVSLSPGFRWMYWMIRPARIIAGRRAE